MKTTDMALSISSAATVCEVSFVSIVCKTASKTGEWKATREGSGDEEMGNWDAERRKAGEEESMEALKLTVEERNPNTRLDAMLASDTREVVLELGVRMLANWYVKTAGEKGQLRLFDKLDGGRRKTHGLSATSSPATCYHEWARCPTRLTRREKKRVSAREERRERKDETRTAMTVHSFLIALSYGPISAWNACFIPPLEPYSLTGLVVCLSFLTM